MYLYWIFYKTQKKGNKGEDAEHVVGWAGIFYADLY